jgi:hypothetical protein
MTTPSSINSFIVLNVLLVFGTLVGNAVGQKASPSEVKRAGRDRIDAAADEHAAARESNNRAHSDTRSFSIAPAATRGVSAEVSGSPSKNKQSDSGVKLQAMSPKPASEAERKSASTSAEQKNQSPKHNQSPTTRASESPK